VKLTQRDRDRDTGMALALLLLLGQLATKREAYAVASGVALLVAMTAPVLLRPLAMVWFGFSHVLGAVMSRVLMTVVFFGVVTPIGIVRRWLGGDSLQVRSFRRGSESVLVARDRRVSGADIVHPY
jgi:hypothetical protein